MSYQSYLGGPSCVSCPATPPDCADCDAGYICILTLQTCEECADTYCLPSEVTSTMPSAPSRTNPGSTDSSGSLSSSAPSSLSTHEEHMHKVHRDAIIGGTIGGVAFLLIVLTMGYFIWSNRKHIFRRSTNNNNLQASKMKKHKQQNLYDTSLASSQTTDGVAQHQYGHGATITGGRVEDMFEAPSHPLQLVDMSHTVTAPDLGSKLDESRVSRANSIYDKTIDAVPIGTRYEDQIARPVRIETLRQSAHVIPHGYSSLDEPLTPEIDRDQSLDAARRKPKTLRERVRQRTSMLLPDRESKRRTQLRKSALADETSGSNRQFLDGYGRHTGQALKDTSILAGAADTLSQSHSQMISPPGRVSAVAPQITLPPMPSQLTLPRLPRTQSWQYEVPEEPPRSLDNNTPSLTESKEHGVCGMGTRSRSDSPVSGSLNPSSRSPESVHTIPIMDPRGYARSAYDEFPTFPEELSHPMPSKSRSSSEFGKASNTIDSYYEGKYENDSNTTRPPAKSPTLPNDKHIAEYLQDPSHSLDISGELDSAVQDALFDRTSALHQYSPISSRDNGTTWRTSPLPLSPVQPLSLPRRQSRQPQLPQNR